MASVVRLLDRATRGEFAIHNPSGLGDMLWLYHQQPDGADASTILDAAIQATQIAAEREQEPSERARLFFNLGIRLDARLKRKGALNDLNEATSAFQTAVKLTSDDDPRQTRYLNRVGNSLIERFGRSGELDDLDGATTAFCCSVELTSDTSPDKPTVLSNYGASLQARFEKDRRARG